MAETFAFGWVDRRAAYGTRQPVLSLQDRQAEAWRRFDRQWDLHLSPDLLRSIVPLSVVRAAQLAALKP